MTPDDDDLDFAVMIMHNHRQNFSMILDNLYFLKVTWRNYALLMVKTSIDGYQDLTMALQESCQIFATTPNKEFQVLMTT